nr:calcium uptake protein, mitochondrial-like isoform X2 [Coffea arabica]
MNSWTFLNKPNPLIRVFAAQSLNQQRLIFTKSNKTSSDSAWASTTASTSSYNHSNNQKGSSSASVLESVLRSLFSGAVVVASSLGLCYCYAFSGRHSQLSYADCGRGPADTESESQPNFLFKDTYRRKVFFNYEKRLRLQSPPEKVFDYFASFRSPSGEVFMTPADLMRAVVPVFPPSGATGVRGGYLKGEKSPGEYIFFVTLLSIPESSFSVAFKMFDLDNDGGIDREEFKKVMALMRMHNRQGAHHRDGMRTGLKVSSSVEDGGLLEYFFGKDGEGRLGHEKFVQFLRDLHNDILRLEFAHYDWKSQGTISAKDFALSMVASADINHINKFLDRVDELNKEPNLKDVCITFEEFKNFAELRKRLRPFSLAIFSYGKVNGLLTKQDFQRAATQVCGISISDNLVDLVFYIFDTNRDGNLSSDEFLRVLQRRESNASQPRGAGDKGLFSCWFECTKKSSSSEIFI